MLTLETPSLSLSSSVSTPLYLLIQPKTSLCQTREFSGFNTHYNCQLPFTNAIEKTTTYMVLVRERQEFRIDPLRLQHVERRQSLRNWQSIVQLVVDDEMGSSPLLEMICGVPLVVIFWIVPERPIEIMMWEEQLFRRVLIESRKNTIVCD